MGDDKRAKQRAGLGSVVPRGAKFRATVMIAGERYSWTVATEAEGDAKIADAKRRHAQGLRAKARPETVAQLLARYLESKDGIAPKTRRSYAQLTKIHLVPRLGKRQVAALTVTEVEAMMRAMMAAGSSPRTAVMARNTLRQAIHWAMRDGDVVRNVAALAAPPPQAPRHAITLSPAQVDRLLGALQAHRLYAAYVVAIALGLREGEILGLRWRDVDFERRTLTIVQQVQDDNGKTVIRPMPKTKASAATLPMPDAVIDALRAHRTLQNAERLRASAWEDHGLIFPATVGRPMNPRNFYRIFENVRDRFIAGDDEHAGDPAWRGVRFHDLRNTCGSWLVARGVQLELVQRILRHTSIHTTNRHYVHLTPDALADAVGKLGEVIDESRKRRGELA